MKEYYFWNARPSALSNLEKYRRASAWQLNQAYQSDSEHCQQQHHHQQQQNSNKNVLGRKGKGGHSALLRTCQWNIQSLNYAVMNNKSIIGSTSTDAAKAVANELIHFDSDVIVLNEFGSYGGYESGIHALKQYLSNEGYTLHQAHGSFPTAIATRLPTSNVTRASLSGDRNAIGMNLKCQDGTTVRIYGTHLADSDFGDGIYRRNEIQKLLHTIDCETASSSFPCSYTMIVGDLNQQRERDYSSEEWTTICANKAERNSPRDDGVASLLENAGFFCMWDQAPRSGGQAKVNWHSTDPPPSTHWTGTIVDYTYASGTDLSVKSLYVSPSTLSDHRLVITDWHWPAR